MYIKDGTITSTKAEGLRNDSGIVELGYSTLSFLTGEPIIEGGTYGVAAADTIYFYDGVIKGKNGSIKDEGGEIKVDDENYRLATNTDSAYKVSYISEKSNVRVASIGTKKYETLQEAINAATDNVETTITLLSNVDENVVVGSAKNIRLVLQNYSINSTTADATIKNNGILTVQDGAINNIIFPVAVNNKGTLNISGGQLTSVGATTSGTLNNATVFNDGGILNMTGGKITSNNTGDYGYAVYLIGSTSCFNISGSSEIISNNSTAIAIHSSSTSQKTIGLNDGTISTQYPLIEGRAKGILSNSPTLIDFYDGIIKSTQDTINYSLINTESSYYVYTGVEIKDNIIYGSTYLGATAPKVAMMDGVSYETLQQAITAAGNNQKTITLLKSTRESVKVTSGQKLTIDFGNHTLANVGDKTVIHSEGKLTILNGSLTTDAPKFAVVDVYGGTTTINGTIIINRGERQAVYNKKGTVIIEGNTYCYTSAPDRPAIDTIDNGTTYIKSGTFIATIKEAVRNQGGNVYIGEDDGIIQNNILLQGTTYGFTTLNKVANKIYFYDGVVKGKNGVIDNSGALVGPSNGGNIIYTIDASNYRTATVTAD